MKVRELLSDPSKWMQGKLAINDGSQFTHPAEPNACRWCLLGATVKCYPENEQRELVINRLSEALGMDTVVTWNDHPNRTFEDVRKLVEELDI